MLDDLISGIKNQVSGQLQGEQGIDSGQLDDIMDVVKNVAGEKIGGQLASGNTEGLNSLFSDKPNDAAGDALQGELDSGIAAGLMEKLGLDGEKATAIVGAVAPVLINMLTKKNNETPEGDNSVLASLLGGDSGDLGGIAKKIGGLFN